MRSVLKLLAVAVAVLFLIGAMVTAVGDLFGDTKVRPLFGMSMEALAATPDGGKTVNANNVDTPRFNATKSGPVPLPRKAKDAGQPTTYFPASKSLGGEGLPGLENPAPPQQQAPQPQAPSPAQQK